MKEQKEKDFTEKLFDDIMEKMDNALNSPNIDKAADELKDVLSKVTSPNKKNKKATKQGLKQELSKVPSYPIKQKNKGQVSGIISQIVGYTGIFSAAMGLAIPGLLTVFGILSPVVFSIISAVLVPLLVGSGALTMWGNKAYSRFKHFKQFRKIIGTKQYCSIEELAKSIDKSNKYTIKEIQKLIQTEQLPQGHIDSNATCLILTDDMYNQYLKAEEAARNKEQQRIRDIQSSEAAEKMDQKENKEIIEVLSKGYALVDQIEVQNNKISGETMSDKLDILSKTARQILNLVKENPNKLEDIRKFLNYYLPTTVKLIYTYAQMEKHVSAGDNVLQTRQEIENTIDTINKAFMTLYDDLFQTEAIDAYADISALQAMLAQEGLTGTDFKK